MKKINLFFESYYRVMLTIVFIALLIVHELFPDFVIDDVCFYLALFAILPWVLPQIPKYVQSFTLPGGWGAVLREDNVKKAIDDLSEEQKSDSPKPAATTGVKKNILKPETINEATTAEKYIPLEDSGLSLIDLGNEIERRLRIIAPKYGIHPEASLKVIIDDLVAKRALGTAGGTTISNILSWRNQVRHGVAVTPPIAQMFEQLRKAAISYINMLENKPVE